MKIRDVAAAVAELDEALSHYKGIYPDLADAFFNEIVLAKQLITQFPSAWKNMGRGTKGFVLRHYPYTLVYQVREDSIWLVSYAHHSRRPGFWADRLQGIH